VELADPAELPGHPVDLGLELLAALEEGERTA
jgi:hypothetical protein